MTEIPLGKQVYDSDSVSCSCAFLFHICISYFCFQYSCLLTFFFIILFWKEKLTWDIHSRFLNVKYNIIYYRHSVVQQISATYLARLKLSAYWLLFAISHPPPQSLVTTIALFDSLNWTILDTLSKWKHFVTDLFHLA